MKKPSKNPPKPTLGANQSRPPVAPTVKWNRQPARHALSATEREAVLRRHRYTCQKCGASRQVIPALELEVDHITPVSRGGTNDPANLQTLCRPCNLAKSNRIE
jgi:5-methylcytosine-specific restriction endonuclease McrA